MMPGMHECRHRRIHAMCSENVYIKKSLVVFTTISKQFISFIQTISFTYFWL